MTQRAMLSQTILADEICPTPDLQGALPHIGYCPMNSTNGDLYSSQNHNHPYYLYTMGVKKISV